MTPEQLLGWYLRNLRLNHGWTIDELSKKIGISRTYLNQIELGQRNCPIKVISKLASSFNLSVSNILDYSGYSKAVR